MQGVPLIVALTTVFALAGIYVTITFVVPIVTERQYCRRVSATRFTAIDGSEGAGSSDLDYFILSFDCRQQDVIIRGEVADAMHWQIGAFDGSLRLIDGGYVNNHTAVVSDGRFEVVVSHRPNVEGGGINCGHSRRGLLIYRVLCADTPPKLPVVQLQQHRKHAVQQTLRSHG